MNFYVFIQVGKGWGSLMYIYWKEKETHILNFLTSDLYWEKLFFLISAIYTQ